MELSLEQEEYLNSRCNLLNGQLRGAINDKAKDLNLELIQMTVADIAIAFYEQGHTDGANESKEQQIRKDLLEDLKSEMP